MRLLTSSRLPTMHDTSSGLGAPLMFSEALIWS